MPKKNSKYFVIDWPTLSGDTAVSSSSLQNNSRVLISFVGKNTGHFSLKNWKQPAYFFTYFQSWHWCYNWGIEQEFSLSFCVAVFYILYGVENFTNNLTEKQVGRSVGQSYSSKTLCARGPVRSRTKIMTSCVCHCVLYGSGYVSNPVGSQWNEFWKIKTSAFVCQHLLYQFAKSDTHRQHHLSRCPLLHVKISLNTSTD